MLIEQKKRDKIKIDYCKKEKIPLIIIRYNGKIDNLLKKITKINEKNVF